MLRLAAALIVVALLTALAGCGSSDEGSSSGDATQERAAAARGGGPSAPIGAAARSCDVAAIDAEGLRVTGVSCQQGQRVMYSWQRASSCAPAGASRSGCTAASYRCASVRADRGLAVSCSRPGRSIAFIAQWPR